MKVKLSRGKVAEVSQRMLPLVKRFKWCAIYQCGRWYAMRNIRKPDGKWTTQRMHRYIMQMLGIEAEYIDHRDGDGLNNRESNLRACTKAENNRNVRKSSRNTSEYKGVSWHKANSKWEAQIQVDCKKIYLGTFNDKIEAARAYDAAAIKYHSEFARTNFQVSA